MFADHALKTFVDQSHIRNVIPGVSQTYVDLSIHIMVRVKLVRPDGSNVDFADHMSVTNNLLQFLFSQWSIILNGVGISSLKHLYIYREYLETFLTYRHAVSHSHLTNAFWYPHDQDFLAKDPPSDASNGGY